MLQLLRRRDRRNAPPTPISNKTPLKHEFVGHTDYIWSLVFLQENVHIMSGSGNGTVRKWDCETGLLVGQPWKVGDKVYSLALSPNREMIVCGRGDRSVQWWDMNGQRMEGIWKGHSNVVLSLSWSPSRCHLSSRSLDGTILIRKAESEEVEADPINANQQVLLQVTELHQAGTSQFPSLTATQASCWPDPS